MFEVLITNSGISLATQRPTGRVIVNQDGTQVPEMTKHRHALGVGDFDGDANAFAAAVRDMMAPYLSDEQAGLAAQVARLQAERDVLAARLAEYEEGADDHA